MRRILLTSSQVSVLVTSLVGMPHSSASTHAEPADANTQPQIVISCTVALFLSGYVIQQRTLRDLRSAIKPRQPRPRPQSSPQFYLPEKFRKTRTLEDGTIVDVEDGNEIEAVAVEVQTVPENEPVVEVAHSEAEPEMQLERESVHPTQRVDKDHSEASSAQIAMMEALQSQVSQKSWAVEHPDPLVKSKVPVSRAERRKLIKDEIHRLSTGDQKVYYQRRLW